MYPDDISLSENIIKESVREAVEAAKKVMGKDLSRSVLFGSCARGDFRADSDIDVMLLTDCDRHENDRYMKDLSIIASSIAMKNFAVINFVCVPEKEFNDKRDWYTFYTNVAKEGIVIDG